MTKWELGTISKRKHRSFLPASSQLRYAAAYILITAAALFLLNLYASTTIRKHDVPRAGRFA